MPSPRTWDLLGGVVTCLQSIAVDDGYYTDAGANVAREREQVRDDIGEPWIAVSLDRLARAEDQAVSRVGLSASIRIAARVPVTLADAEQRLHELIDDVRRAMEHRQSTFGAGLQFPRFVEATLLPPAEGIAWVGADLIYTAHVIHR